MSCVLFKPIFLSILPETRRSLLICRRARSRSRLDDMDTGHVTIHKIQCYTAARSTKYTTSGDPFIYIYYIPTNENAREEMNPSPIIVEAIGYAGGLLIAIAILPQVIHTWRTKSTQDISYGYLTIDIAGCILTYTYFVLKQATAAWVCLTFELACAIFILTMKIHFDGSCCDKRIKGDRDEVTADDTEISSVHSDDSVETEVEDDSPV